jgi:phosphatidate cytidylyltransferase
VALLSIEWAKMSAPSTPVRMATVITACVLAAMFIAYLGHFRIAWLVMAGCAVLAALIAGNLAERRTDAAFGVIYLAAPMLALIWLRGKGDDDAARAWILMLFFVAWTADSLAFIIGSLLKGPKLWPRFSPNKTWSGFVGGLIGAVIAALVVSSIHIPGRFDAGLTLLAAVVVGLAGGLATMGGDLLESMLKRRFGVKDSGDLIPGHGGLLDRVDGLMAAVLAIAAMRLIDLVRLGL